MTRRPISRYDIAGKMIVDVDPVAFARLCGPADSAEFPCFAPTDVGSRGQEAT